MGHPAKSGDWVDMRNSSRTDPAQGLRRKNRGTCPPGNGAWVKSRIGQVGIDPYEQVPSQGPGRSTASPWLPMGR